MRNSHGPGATSSENVALMQRDAVQLRAVDDRRVAHQDVVVDPDLGRRLDGVPVVDVGDAAEPLAPAELDAARQRVRGVVGRR